MNLGAQKLRIVIEPRGKQQALAHILEVDPAVVMRWAFRGLDGRGSKPNAKNRLALLSLLGIELSDWDRSTVDKPDVSELKVDFEEPPECAPAAPFRQGAA